MILKQKVESQTAYAKESSLKMVNISGRKCRKSN